MINELEIHNFKSIKDLTLPCKRFNLFIGEPNTGKSNILEALGLVSFVGARHYQDDAKLDGFVRHEYLSNLFYDDEIAEELSVRCDGVRVDLSFQDGMYFGTCAEYIDNDEKERIARISGNNDAFAEVTIFVSPRPRSARPSIEPPQIKFYRFATDKGFSSTLSSYLLPPYGQNLPSLLLQNRDLRNLINFPFSSAGLRLGLRPHENTIELIKQAEDIIISYPYSLASDTLRRITFYTAAIETSNNSVIVLEEPEAHSFPGETKILAEQIAMDENDNQYFIVTHNPYFLMPLLSKAPKDDIAINIVYSEEYQTKVRGLKAEELPELFELDIFANMERFLEP